MFKAGILSEGELTISEEGVPQGSICSPVMSNIFAHYVLDKWIEETVKPVCKGIIGLFRYADDAVICCQYDTDAQRIRQSLVKRLEKFKLQLNEGKTKLVSFDKREAARGIEQETVDFLGFTFYWGNSKTGVTIPKLRTRAKTLRTKLKKTNKWFKEIRNKGPLKAIWKTFKAKLRGHIQYYGVSHNFERVGQFVRATRKIAFKWLNRRSQRKSFTWGKFILFIAKNPLPEARIIHKMF